MHSKALIHANFLLYCLIEGLVSNSLTKTVCCKDIQEFQNKILRNEK